MSIIYPEVEYVDRSSESVRYLEHGWPSDLCRWHSHNEFELHFITQGQGKVFIGDYIGEFDGGALFLTGPNLPHNWITSNTCQQPIAIRDMLVQFNLESVKHLVTAFSEFNDIYATLDIASFGIEFVGYEACKAKSHLETIRDAKGSKRIMGFLNFLLSVHEHKDKKLLSTHSIFQPKENSKNIRITDVIDYVSEHYSENISLQEAASMAGMSLTVFSQKFKKITGKKFVEFVNSIRISQACSLLYLSDKLISTICYDVGFQNLANFNRHFIKMKHMSPSQYRNLARAKLSKKI